MTERLIPYPYQEEAIERAVNEPSRGVLIGSELGKGKTLIACEILVRREFERVLIVAPLNVRDQWRERLAAQSEGRIELRHMQSTKSGREAFADFLAGKPGYYFAGRDWLRTQNFTHRDVKNPDGSLKYVVDKKTGLTTFKVERERVHLGTYQKMKTPLDAVVYDEVHEISGRKSASRRTMGTIKSIWRIALSGTWNGNSFEGAWPVCTWVWPGDDPNTGRPYVETAFSRWRERWCSTEEVRIPGGKVAIKVTGERVPGAFADSLPLYIRHEAEEHAPASQIVEVDLTATQRQVYEDLERDMVAWLDDNPLVVDLPIVLRQRLRTATLAEPSLDEDGGVYFEADCRSPKLQALAGVLTGYLGPERPALILTDSRLFANVAAYRLQRAGFNAEAWTGDTSHSERARIKADFMEGRTRYLVASIAALSTGVDGLQKGASAIVWLSRSENQLLNDQVTGRIFRPGMTKEWGEFVQVDIHARDTLDGGTFGRLLATRLRNRASMRAA